MLFNSLSFAIFAPIVFFLYWFIKPNSRVFQNIILLAASYVFYAFWNVNFLFLLLGSTLLDYWIGIRIANATSQLHKKILLVATVVVNLGILAYFKYCNFFIDSFSDFVRALGFEPHVITLSIMLPVGISFYTFHGLSYLFDVYHEKTHARYNFIDYSLFVSFFPLLVAGPIERATHLLPQIEQDRQFDYQKAFDGLRQILWGFFKKVIIADNCAEYANMAFNNSAGHTGSSLALGAVFFAFQIYGDFSGYSDIALGVARLFGFELLKNFSFPYFSRDIAEFWRRWHISLTTWFRDYLYFPLGGSRGSKLRTIRNTFIIFLVSGFWHGANWTFIAWGGLHALFFIPLLVLGKNRKNIETVASGKLMPSLRDVYSIVITFSLVVFAWIFFRANSIEHAISIIGTIVSPSFFSIPMLNVPWYLYVILAGFILIEWVGRENQYALAAWGVRWPRLLRWSFYYLLVFIIFYFTGNQHQFIYFQF